MNIAPFRVTLESLLSGLDTKYRVPEYQRDYSWTQDQCSALWADLHHAADRDADYFMGTLVLNSENKVRVGGLEIVDGQQRLATFSVLAAVIRDRCTHFLANPADPIYSKIDLTTKANVEKAKRCGKLVEQLLLHSSEPDHYYIELNQKDQSVFYNFVQKPGDPIPEDKWKEVRSESRIIKAKKYFTRRIASEYLRIGDDGFCRLHAFVSFIIKKLIFLKIEVITDNDAYLLFESLNDRGLDLSISDLIKNRLLLQCGTDFPKRKRILDLWSEMTNNLSESRYTQSQEYIRVFWAAFFTPTTKKELYGSVKEHLSNRKTDVEQFMVTLGVSSRQFSEFTDRDLLYPSSGLTRGSKKAALAEINTLGYSVCYPFLLRLRELRPRLEDTALPYIRDYLFRLITIGNFAANRAEKAFQSALNKLKSNLDDNSILDCLTDPEIDDAAFETRFRQARFEDNNTAKYVLSKLHDHESTPALCLTKEAHLEHVLPQDPSSWSFVTIDSAPVDDYIYSIGNMILLEEKINKSIQNSRFEDKVSRYQRKTGTAGHTTIPMAFEIHEQFTAGQTAWDAKRISERAARISSKAIKIWPHRLPDKI